MRKLKIISQLIALTTFLFLGGLILFTKIPGYGAICDAEQIYLVYLYLLFIIVFFLFLVNSIHYYKKNNWKKYRLFVIRLSVLILFLIFSLRSIYTLLYYGFAEYKIENRDNDKGVITQITLYKNGKFFSYTYDCSCETENSGTYKITDKELKLYFNTEKPVYLDTIYKINGNLLTCENCAHNNMLIFNKKYWKLDKK